MFLKTSLVSALLLFDNNVTATDTNQCKNIVKKPVPFTLCTSVRELPASPSRVSVQTNTQQEVVFVHTLSLKPSEYRLQGKTEDRDLLAIRNFLGFGTFAKNPISILDRRHLIEEGLRGMDLSNGSEDTDWGLQVNKRCGFYCSGLRITVDKESEKKFFYPFSIRNGLGTRFEFWFP